MLDACQTYPATFACNNISERIVIQKQFRCLKSNLASNGRSDGCGQQQGGLPDVVHFTIASQKTRLDTSIAEFQKQFSTAQETRSLEFQKLLTQLKEAADKQSTAIQDHSNSTSESRKSFL